MLYNEVIGWIALDRRKRSWSGSTWGGTPLIFLNREEAAKVPGCVEVVPVRSKTDRN